MWQEETGAWSIATYAEQNGNMRAEGCPEGLSHYKEHLKSIQLHINKLKYW